MNNESPLVPQGSFLEQKNQGRARVKIAVFVVLAIHGVGLMALLMQGCQKAPDVGPGAATTETNLAPIAPTFVETTNIVPVLPDTNPPTVVQTTAPPVVVPEPVPVQPTPTALVTQHKIVSGDTFSKLAKDYKVSVKAIEAANPGVESSRLRIGQTIQIPAPGLQAPALTVAPMSAEPVPNGSKTYKVKSGDTLIRIANNHGVSVKALRAANGLRTDRIRVDQTLKIPAKNGGTPAPAAMLAPMPLEPAPATTSAPVSTLPGNP